MLSRTKLTTTVLREFGLEVHQFESWPGGPGVKEEKKKNPVTSSAHGAEKSWNPFRRPNRLPSSISIESWVFVVNSNNVCRASR